MVATTRALVLLIAMLPYAAGVAQAQNSSPPMEAAVLRPGDAVRIEVWRQPELSGEFALAADGTVVHPLYKDLVLTGVSLDLLEGRVRRFLQEYETNPAFVVEPRFRVSVGGEVRMPNLYVLAPDVTVSQAVAMAGGATERGRLDRVELIRGGVSTSLDLTAPDSRADDLRVMSGDRIVVARRGDSFFRSVFVPATSVLGAVAAIVNLFR